MRRRQTIARKIAAQFGTSNQNKAGEWIEEVCYQFGTPRANRSCQRLSYEFSDGSRIVLAAGTWGVGHPTCTCGFCMEHETTYCGQRG